MGNFKFLYDALKNLSIWYIDLLIEDKFAGTMPNGIVMSLALCHLLILVGFKGGISFYHIVNYVD